MKHPFYNDEIATQWAIDWLHAKGYSITLRPEAAPVKVKVLRGQLGMKSSAFHKRLHHPKCPLFRSDRGPSTRITRLWLTPELLAWLSRPIKPGKRSAT